MLIYHVKDSKVATNNIIKIVHGEHGEVSVFQFSDVHIVKTLASPSRRCHMMLKFFQAYSVSPVPVPA